MLPSGHLGMINAKLSCKCQLQKKIGFNANQM